MYNHDADKTQSFRRLKAVNTQLFSAAFFHSGTSCYKTDNQALQSAALIHLLMNPLMAVFQKE